MQRSIEWRHDGQRLIVPVVILTPSADAQIGMVEAQALVDTGSTTTGIKRSVAVQLKLRSIGKRPMSTVTGDGQIERYVFRVGFNGDRRPGEPPTYPFVFEEIIGFELRGGFHFDVLLGMDVLRECGLMIDRAGNCRLSFGA